MTRPTAVLVAAAVLALAGAAVLLRGAPVEPASRGLRDLLRPWQA